MPVTALIGNFGNRSRKGGGLLYLIPWVSTKLPYQPHASLDTAYATGTVLSCYRAPVADTHTPASFGATGTLNVDLFPASGFTLETNKAYSALATNDFTITALAGAHPVGALISKYSADDYAPADWQSFGYLGGTKLRLKHADDDDKDERGVMVSVLAGDIVREIATSIKQSSKHEIDFLDKEAPGKYYAAKYVVPVGDDGFQVIVAAKVAIVCDAELDYNKDSTRVIPVTLKFITVGADQPYVVYEG